LDDEKILSVQYDVLQSTTRSNHYIIVSTTDDYDRQSATISYKQEPTRGSTININYFLRKYISKQLQGARGAGGQESIGGYFEKVAPERRLS